MIPTGLRSRVERLLRGDVREQDLHALFFNMREESHNRGLVSEIAHFLAHPQLRTQGITTDELRDFFAFAKFRFPMASSSVAMTDLPASVPNALRANLRRISKDRLKWHLRTTPLHAKRVLERVLSRLAPTG